MATPSAVSPTALTPEERDADLTAERLKQLVGLVDYDASTDPFPVTAMDAIVFVSGNATQSARFYQSRVGHAARRLQRPRDRQPRPQGIRAARGLGAIRDHRRGGVRQRPRRPPPPPRRRRDRSGPRSARRRPVHRARATRRRHDPRRAAQRERRARHGPARRHCDLRRHPPHAGRPLLVQRRVPARIRRAVLRDPGSGASPVPSRRSLRRQRRARPHGRVGRPSTTASWAS